MSDRGRDIFSMKPSVGFNETSIPPEFLRPFPLPLRHPAAGYPPRDNGRTRVPDLRPPMLAATGGPLHPPISALQLQHAHKSLGLLGLLPPLIPLNGVERAPLHLPHQVAMTRLKIFSPEELNYRGASLPNQNNLSHHNEDHRNHQGAALSSDEEGKEREMSNREREEYHRILDKKRGIKRKADLISGSSLTPPRVTSPTVNLRRLNLSLSGNTVLTTNHQTYTSRDHNQHQQHTPPERLPENGRPDGLQQPDKDTPLNLTSPRLKVRVDVKKTATNSEQLKSLSLKERNSLKPNKTTAPKPRDGQSINKKSHRKEDRRTRLLDEGRRQRQAQQQQLQLQQKQAAAAGGRQNNNHQEKNNVDNDPDEQQELTDNVDDQNNTSDQGNKSTSTIDCPVCKDVAIAHFHYGGMCCYSCKAFFRRVVNTSKASKYKCRSGKNDCDISFANRRSCQACRYRKCVAAGMKPALVLSDEQCSKRFGHKKSNSRSGGDDPDDPDAVLDDSRVDASHQDSEVTKEDLALLIDGEKSYEEQNKIGRTLFVSLFDTGSVRNDGLEDRELDKYSSINETVAMVKSFQIERQLNHSRQYLPFNSDKSGEKRKLLNENGKVNTGDIAQTLIDQTIMLLRHNKHFNSLQLNDQTELLECNLMAVTLLTIFEAYHGTSRSVVWKLTEPDFAWLKNHKIKVPHGRLSFNIQDLLKEVDTDLKEEATKLFNFFDYFYQIGLPRASLYILLFVIVFNQNFAETKNKDDIEDSRKYYLFALFETIAVSEGVLGACSIAARLHSCLNDLTRIAQVLGQKFIDVEEN